MQVWWYCSIVNCPRQLEFILVSEALSYHWHTVSESVVRLIHVVNHCLLMNCSFQLKICFVHVVWMFWPVWGYSIWHCISWHIDNNSNCWWRHFKECVKEARQYFLYGSGAMCFVTRDMKVESLGLNADLVWHILRQD